MSTEATDCTCESTYKHLSKLSRGHSYCNRAAISWTCAQHGQVSIDDRELRVPPITLTSTPGPRRPGPLRPDRGEAKP